MFVRLYVYLLNCVAEKRTREEEVVKIDSASDVSETVRCDMPCDIVTCHVIIRACTVIDT